MGGKRPENFRESVCMPYLLSCSLVGLQLSPFVKGAFLLQPRQLASMAAYTTAIPAAAKTKV
jgi:hypothetical protein